MRITALWAIFTKNWNLSHFSPCETGGIKSREISSWWICKKITCLKSKWTLICLWIRINIHFLEYVDFCLTAIQLSRYIKLHNLNRKLKSNGVCICWSLNCCICHFKNIWKQFFKIPSVSIGQILSLNIIHLFRLFKCQSFIQTYFILLNYIKFVH